MINLDGLENEVKKGQVDNSYIFCGLDEELIKEGIEKIVNKVLDKNFLDLNYIRLDGMITTIDEIINACETMPFLGEKKVVVIYRANFLKEKSDSSNSKTYKEVSAYLKILDLLILYL